MVSVQREVELKFAASDDFVLPDLSQSRRWAVAGPAREVRLEAVYYDTDTLTLAREGIGVYGHAQRLRRPGTNTVFVIPLAVPPSGRWTVDNIRPDNVPQSAR